MIISFKSMINIMVKTTICWVSPYYFCWIWNVTFLFYLWISQQGTIGLNSMNIFFHHLLDNGLYVTYFHHLLVILSSARLRIIVNYSSLTYQRLRAVKWFARDHMLIVVVHHSCSGTMLEWSGPILGCNGELKQENQ